MPSAMFGAVSVGPSAIGARRASDSIVLSASRPKERLKMKWLSVTAIPWVCVGTGMDAPAERRSPLAVTV